ncbi:histidine phosphatase family protein [Nesterenkonia muleiensis]|uniref:histidine phosphatase family protein n=1 Tax=Nesterenkonia muleiensis TaxID=2282648 RepID=UPI000E73024E
MAELLRDLSVDGILVSPLGRARATAAIIAEALGVLVAVCKDLAELNLGEMGGLTRGEFGEPYPGALHKRSQNWHHWRFLGGESDAGVAERAASALHAARLVTSSDL